MQLGGDSTLGAQGTGDDTLRAKGAEDESILYPERNSREKTILHKGIGRLGQMLTLIIKCFLCQMFHINFTVNLTFCIKTRISLEERGNFIYKKREIFHSVKFYIRTQL